MAFPQAEEAEQVYHSLGSFAFLLALSKSACASFHTPPGQ